MKSAHPAILPVLFILTATLFPTFASAQPALLDAIRGGAPLIDLRLRYENVDQESKPRNAAATTFRASSALLPKTPLKPSLSFWADPRFTHAIVDGTTRSSSTYSPG